MCAGSSGSGASSGVSPGAAASPASDTATRPVTPYWTASLSSSSIHGWASAAVSAPTKSGTGWPWTSPTTEGTDWIWKADRPADYLAAAATARSVASTAESLARDYARRARGAGHSWDEVAAALKFDAAGHDDPSVEAFLWVAPTPSQRFDSIVTSWECASCAARVTDRGPFGGHPEEVEEGHLDSCARHQEDISAYRQQTGWDD